MGKSTKGKGDFKLMLDKRVAAVKSLERGGVRISPRVLSKNGKEESDFHDDPMLLQLLEQERLKHTTKKTLKTLRERLKKLDLIRVLGTCGVWSEFVWLHQELGVSRNQTLCRS